MNRRILFTLMAFFIAGIVSAQAPLPLGMKSLARIKGFTDGSGYRVWSNNNAIDHLHWSWPENKTVTYAAGMPASSKFVYGDEQYSPDGLSMAGNYYPARISEQYPIAKKDYRDWRTKVSIGKRDGKGGLVSRDSLWYDDHFAVGITNDGLLICSDPKLKSKESWEKNELIKLTGLYTYNLNTKEKHKLIDGKVWDDEQYGSKPYRWGLTPNSRYFYYYDDDGIHFWDLVTYDHLYRKMPFDKGFALSVSDNQSVMQGRINSDVWKIFINNITGAELYRVKVENGTPGYFYTANELLSINGPRATVTFWQLDSAEMKEVRSVVLDTLYMTDGPMDNNERFRIQVITPQYAAVYNQYDRLYVMKLDYGKSHIVYSDIKGERLARIESDAAVKKAKEDCKRNEDAVKFKTGTTITLNGKPYIISSFDCYSNKYSIATVVPFTQNPPYSAATILRYDLKPVNKLTSMTETIAGKELGVAILSPVQYEFCDNCHGAGGRWVSSAVSGPVVLLNSSTLAGVYKPLGTMVYNYHKCAVCNGSCWRAK